MRAQVWICGALCAVSVGLPTGCRRGESRQPPPDARRPVIKTEAELAAERAARIEAGQVVPTSAPVVPGADPAAVPRRRLPPPIRPTPGAIEADILMVNNAVLTVAEVLYPLREEIERIRQTQTQAGFRERVRQLARQETQREVGSLLIYAEAMASLSEEQHQVVEKAAQEEVDGRVTREFGGSSARLTSHLAEHGLTVDQFRHLLQRELVVRQYAREKLMPLVQIRRDELWAYYQRNISRYQTPETRELLLVELPFEKLLPEGRQWNTAPQAVRAGAKLTAMRRARAAHEALEERPFEEVAREYSVGPHAEQGGSWGMIGRPLQSPYDQLSRLIFEYEQGQYSEPVETESGWYIVKCGRIEPGSQRAFVDVQDEIRRELMERRFTKLSVDYVLRLAEEATISSLDLFLAAAVQRAEQPSRGATTSRESE